MSNSRDEIPARIVEVVERGHNVEVVGAPDSGRSHTLQRVAARLVEADRPPIAVRGTAALRQHTLAALRLAGIGAEVDPRRSWPVLSSIEDLRRRAAERPVIIVDGWDELDESSQGVLVAANRELHVPIVSSFSRTRMRGDGPMHTLVQVPDMAFRFELDEVGFDELEAILTAKYAAPVDQATVSRVYAKSGGSIGTAIRIVDAALFDGRIRRTDGRLTAVRDLWSPLLAGIVQARLSALRPEERAAVEVLALVGTIDLDSAARLIGDETIEMLEDLGLVRLFPSGDADLIAISPPLFVEYFRHRERHARRHRLSIETREVLGEVAGAVTASVDRSDSTADPVFVRLVLEKQRARLLAARTAWRKHHDCAAGVQLAQALLADFTPSHEVDELLASEPRVSDPEHTARWISFSCWHRAYRDDALDASLADFERAAAEMPEWAAYLRANAVELEFVMRGVPADAAERIGAVDADAHPRIAARQLRALALLATADGRFSESDALVERAAAPLEFGLSPSVTLLTGLNMIGRGELRSALAYATSQFEDAHASLDAERLRVAAYLGVFATLTVGGRRDIDRMVETVLSLGDPPEFPQLAQLGLLAGAAASAARRGHRSSLDTYLQALDRLTIHEGPFPGMSRAWALAQLEAATGHLPEAADLVWNAAREHEERGYVFSAAVLGLGSLEFVPDHDRIRAMRERLTRDDELVARQLKYLDALDTDDPDELLDAVDPLVEEGRLGNARFLLARARRLLEEAGRVDDARIATARLDALAPQLDAGQTGQAFAHPIMALTEREREVARRVAAGMSNQQVADELVVSVRTVESHLHRVMRKLGVGSRRDLARFADELEDEPR
ncbi:helix-turn-helix domain-containing protein [Agromyces archimandritae]|uniref:HTH luxR-type domain-containing protein n=1 Tax=Agromyces archimandritae TaxID=2781962 RepID=A0A975IPD3_9MICO|nr:helix-turn-helix transcriptional regulator [Agromyces archimandritae]QTX03876.1 hypothetical protein G127AT_11205 [Agromyces archimandritae]